MVLEDKIFFNFINVFFAILLLSPLGPSFEKTLNPLLLNDAFFSSLVEIAQSGSGKEDLNFLVYFCYFVLSPLGKRHSPSILQT